MVFSFVNVVKLNSEKSRCYFETSIKVSKQTNNSPP